MLGCVYCRTPCGTLLCWYAALLAVLGWPLLLGCGSCSSPCLRLLCWHGFLLLVLGWLLLLLLLCGPCRTPCMSLLCWHGVLIVVLRRCSFGLLLLLLLGRGRILQGSCTCGSSNVAVLARNAAVEELHCRQFIHRVNDLNTGTCDD